MAKHKTDKEINIRVQQVTEIDILQIVHVRLPFRVWMLVREFHRPACLGVMKHFRPMSDETRLMTQHHITRESELRETENLRQYAEGEDSPPPPPPR